MSKTTSRGARTGTASPAVDITTYPNAVKFLFDRVDFERTRSISLDTKSMRLDRTRQLMAALGNPQDGFRSVHIAGTVGKGSTVAMIAAMLRACGYTVGEYTSPHLIDVRERIVINGKPIGRAEFTEVVRDVAAASADLPFQPTFFEFITAVAFRHFLDQAVDIAVVEVGLGGRLDCTNVITPEVAVICGIDFDHMHILGKTLPEIAREKAGIFKAGVPALSIEQPPEVEAAMREVAEQVGCPLSFVNKEIEFSYRFGASAHRGPETRVCLFSPTTRFEHVPVPLPGEHQAQNCGVSLAVIDALKSRGYNLPEAEVLKGLATTKVPGRMELIWDRPRILVDGAHNPAALQTLVKTVGAYVPYDSMVVIFGCCDDKDVPAMLDRLALGGDKVIFTKAKKNPRAKDPEELSRIFNERSGKMSQTAADIGEALNLAARAVGRGDLICVTGSFYLVGDAKKYLTELEKKK